MKREWICNWEIAPGDGEHRKKFNSYDEANAAIRKLISENINISVCVNKLKRKGNFQYINTIAEFLTRYFSDPKFPYSTDNIPSDNPEDYTDYNGYPQNDEFFDTEDDRDAYFYVSKGGFLYVNDGYVIRSSFVLDKGDINKNYYIESYDDELCFEYINDNEYSNSGAANNINLHLVTGETWGSSAYPVMVLKTLQDSDRALSQTEIISHISERYKVFIERKAVGRHLDMLSKVGYKIQKSKDGFFIAKD